MFVNSKSLSSVKIGDAPVDDPSLKILVANSSDTLRLLKMSSCPHVSSDGRSCFLCKLIDGFYYSNNNLLKSTRLWNIIFRSFVKSNHLQIRCKLLLQRIFSPWPCVSLVKISDPFLTISCMYITYFDHVRSRYLLLFLPPLSGPFFFPVSPPSS